ncbi:hypothetical protein AVEN_254542-1 [Araneus ventricosus]|uniref:Retrotransposon gag domain-containing protein n=1 Tax=Araneus ventricosus TaxID=182803 RepID=A0A4Y2M797_ARAVE|nr:hypothetical protein AVEN_254542-1 [Araneus ventricosus]
MTLSDSQSTQNANSSHVYMNSNFLTSNQLHFIPPFSGSNDSQSITDFLTTVEEIADHFGWNNGSKYLAVKLRITGEALHFIREQKFSFNDYDSLKKVLIERYTIQSNKASFFQEFFTFQQPQNMPVSVFFAKASALSFKTFCTGERNRDIEEANRIEMQKSMLLTNLAPEIQRGVIAANPKTIDEIKEAAFLQERAWNSYRPSPSCLVSNKTYPSPVYAVQVRAENANQCVEVFVTSW